jgi:hypothetical protein
MSKESMCAPAVMIWGGDAMDLDWLNNIGEWISRVLPSLTILLGVLASILAAVAQITATESFRAFVRKLLGEKKQRLPGDLSIQEVPGYSTKGGDFPFDENSIIRDTKLSGSRIPTSSSISANLLKEYHAQGLSQSRVSFWFSIMFSSIGFAIIAMSIGLFAQQQFYSSSNGWLDAAEKPAFALIAGVIIEAVSALFFVQSNKTRQLMTEFFDKLRNDRKLDESLQLIDNIKSDIISSRLRAVVALHFAEVKIDHESVKYLLADEKASTGIERIRKASRSGTAVKTE